MVQNAINGTMNTVSFGSVSIAFLGGLFDFAMPLNKYFDAFWTSAISAELAIAYDFYEKVKAERNRRNN